MSEIIKLFLTLYNCGDCPCKEKVIHDYVEKYICTHIYSKYMKSKYIDDLEKFTDGCPLTMIK
jgi:hypothetical protein